MSYYSNNPAHVRVDFFKEYGKWGYTEMVDMTGYYDDGLTADLVKAAVLKHLDGRLKGMIAVCLDPYCKYSFPVMFRID